MALVGGVSFPAFEPVRDLFMQDIEEHGGEGHAEENVEGTEPLRPLMKSLQLSSLMSTTVTEADGGEGEEAEVEAVEEPPLLPPGHHVRAQADVT